jgi:hypothetical protein
MRDILKELDELLEQHNKGRQGWQRMMMPSSLEEQNKWRRDRAYLCQLGYLHYRDLRGIAGQHEEWKISTEGEMFLRKGGFVGQEQREEEDRLWQRVKTVGTVLYSVLVLAVAVWAVCVEMGRN